MLKRNDVKASFACVGKLTEQEEEIHKSLDKEEHQLTNRAHIHQRNPVLAPRSRFDEISEEEQGEEIVECHSVIEDLPGERPISLETHICSTP